MGKETNLINKIKNLNYIITILFVSLLFCWIIIHFSFDFNEQNLLYWAATYQIIALSGAIGGIIVAKSWGGMKSLIGKSVCFFSLGLLFQVFGQSSFSYFNLILKVEIPYPSVADIGFFGSMISYILGTIYLAMVIRVHTSAKTLKARATAAIIPLIMLVGSYLFFLRGYELDWTQPLKIFLDFGYPLGDAVYVSFALATLLLSTNFLGGIMKWPMLFVLFSLIAQYIADFNFLYQASQLTWLNGGYGDLLYMISYFITAMSLVHLGLAFNKIRES
jgi:hypothetical protein